MFLINIQQNIINKMAKAGNGKIREDGARLRETTAQRSRVAEHVEEEQLKRPPATRQTPSISRLAQYFYSHTSSLPNNNPHGSEKGFQARLNLSPLKRSFQARLSPVIGSPPRSPQLLKQPSSISADRKTRFKEEIEPVEILKREERVGG